MDLLFVGEKGGGKTLTAVRTMVQALASGRHVTSNIVLLWDKADYADKMAAGLVSTPRRSDLPSAQVKALKAAGDYAALIPKLWGGVDAYTFSRWHCKVDRRLYHYLPDEQSIYDCQQNVVRGESEARPSLLVLDELNIYYPAREWGKNQVKAASFLKWLVQARKFHVDCIFIIQAVKNLDATIIRQVSQVWKFHDWRTVKIPILWGIGGKFKIGWHNVTISTFFPNDLGCKNPPREAFLVDRRLYELYDTDAGAGDTQNMLTPMDEIQNSVDEKSIRKNRFRARVALFAMPVCLLAGCMRHERMEYERLSSQLRDRLAESSNIVQRVGAPRSVQYSGLSDVRNAPVVSSYPRSVVVDGRCQTEKGWSYRVLDVMLSTGDWWEELGGYVQLASEDLVVVRRTDGLLYGVTVKVAIQHQSQSLARGDSGIPEARRRAYSPAVTE